MVRVVLIVSDRQCMRITAEWGLLGFIGLAKNPTLSPVVTFW